MTEAVYRSRQASWRTRVDASGLGGTLSFGYPSFTGSGTTGHSTIRHLSGWTARFGPSALALAIDGSSLLVVPTGHDLIYARASFGWIDRIESAPPPQVAVVAGRWLADRAGDRPIGITGYADVPYQTMLALRELFDVTNLDPEAAEERKLKDDFALEHHRRAAGASDAMLSTFFGALGRPDSLDGGRLMPEVEVAGRYEGAELAACWMSVGNNGAPAYRIEEVRGHEFPPGEKALVGTYVTVGGYWAHCLRTAFRTPPGTDMSADAREGLAMAIDQHAAAVGRIRAGQPASYVAQAALDWIDNTSGAAHGDECFRQAHFLGLDYAEYPTNLAFAQPPCWFSAGDAAPPSPDVPLEEGMVMEIHTNFEHHSLGLLVMGDVYLVTGNGPERLTGVPQNPYAGAAGGRR